MSTPLPTWWPTCYRAFAPKASSSCSSEATHDGMFSLPRVARRRTDTAPYFSSARAFVVPLRYGGGTRLKILESLARGVPVVSTAAGCEGLELRDGREILIRDEPEGFAEAIDRLLTDDTLCAQLASAGRDAVEHRYDWSAVGAAFSESLSRVIG
jgi:glycosyltransferase involved in cell wall biosynthesis